MTKEEKKDQNFEDMNSESSIFVEFWEFICENKKFWLIPIIIILLIMGLLILASSSAIAPFIYTMF